MEKKAKVNASILIIGNEILSGRTQDTNTSTIATWLNSKGVSAVEVRLYAEEFAVSEEYGLKKMFGDNRYVLAARTMVRSMADRGNSAWIYYVDFVPQSRAKEWPGTPHGIDGYYLWAGESTGDPQTAALSMRLQDYWVNFARSGNPNGGNLVQWPAYGFMVNYKRSKNSTSKNRTTNKKCRDNF